LWKSTISFILRSAWNILSPPGWVFMEFYIKLFFLLIYRECVSFNNVKKKNKEHFTWTCMCIYVNISLSSSWNEKSFRKNVEKIRTRILYWIKFLRKSRRLWYNEEKHGRVRQATDESRMRFVCWITKATGTHLEGLIFIAFLRQQWLGESTSVLRSYGHCLSCSLCVGTMWRADCGDNNSSRCVKGKPKNSFLN
jgi:hypothetical protein